MPYIADSSYGPAHIQIKSSRAQEHLDALQSELGNWLADPNLCSIFEKTDFENRLQIFRFELKPMSEKIPMLLGDFVCNLRSALDQLAWRLAHLDANRTFSEKEERRISFPIFKFDDSTYANSLKLFPSAVAKVLDRFQPHKRGSAFKDDLLWQLNELWTMDKHRAIPLNNNSLRIHFPLNNWAQFLRTGFYNAVEVHFPLMLYLQSKVHLQPTVSVEILFGEYMGEFAVPRDRLKEMNDFVRNEVWPEFAGFFA